MSFPVPHRIRAGRASDAGELLTLQRAAFVSEAQQLRTLQLAPLQESLADVHAALQNPSGTVLLACITEDGEWGHRGRLVAAVRLRVAGELAHLSRVVVAPDLQGRGLGTALLEGAHREASARPGVTRLQLLAGSSSPTLALYRRLGYSETGTDVDEHGTRHRVLTRTL